MAALRQPCLLLALLLCTSAAVGLHIDRSLEHGTSSLQGARHASVTAAQGRENAADPGDGGHVTAARGGETAGHVVRGPHGVLDSVHALAHSIVMPLTGILIVCVLLGNWLSMNPVTAVVPDSAWTVFISCTLGFALRSVLESGALQSDRLIIMVAQFLNLFLLPIIIFESGWSLNHFNFMSQLEHISLFAVLGTLISFFFVGLAGTWLGQNGYTVVTSARENFVFAALISAVDPVATLATFSQLGLDTKQPLLHTMIFGESVVNDAVAIVLFVTINEGWASLTWVGCARDIAWLLFGSAGFGIFLAALLILMMRLASLPGRSVPVVIFFVTSAWFVYAAAEGWGFSGIIANLCAGSMFKMYGSKHLDADGVEHATSFQETLGHMCDTLVFILVGIASAFIDGVSGPYFAGFACLLCLLGRALSTASCGVLANAVKRCNGEPEGLIITARHQVIMWWSGLRGGIALVLVLQIHTSWCTQKQTLVNATFLVIVSSLLVLGSTTQMALKAMKFTGQEEGEGEDTSAAPPELAHETQSMEATPTSADHEMAHQGLMGQLGRFHCKTQFYRGLNKFWLFVLVGDEQLNSERRQRKEAFASHRKVGGPAAQKLKWSMEDAL